MNVFKTALFSLIAVTLSFAAPAPKSSATAASAAPAAPATQEQKSTGLSVSPEEMFILMALLQSPVFKDNFVQSCSAQSAEWLGAAQAEKSCQCAFDKLIGDKEAMAKVLGSVSADGSNVDISKWGFGVVEPCLPKDFPAEMDGAFVKECLKQKDLDKQVCTCMLKSVKKDYTVHSLIKTAFEDQKKLEMDITLKAAQCLAK